MKIFQASFVAGVVAVIGWAIDLVSNHGGNLADVPALNPVEIITLLGILATMVVGVVGMFANLRRSQHQNRHEDSDAVKASQESVDIATARALRLELVVQARDSEIQLLNKRLLQKGPVYTVSFVLDTSGITPDLRKVVVNELAPGGQLVVNGQIAEKDETP